MPWGPEAWPRTLASPPYPRNGAARKAGMPAGHNRAIARRWRMVRPLPQVCLDARLNPRQMKAEQGRDEAEPLGMRTRFSEMMQPFLRSCCLDIIAWSRGDSWLGRNRLTALSV